MNRVRITVLPLSLGTILLLASHALAQPVQEVRVRWDAYLAPSPQVTPQQAVPADILTLLERRRVPGSLPKQRHPQFSSDQIAIQAVDSKGDVIDGQLIPD